MSGQSVISHAPIQAVTMVTGIALMAPVRVNLVKTEAAYRTCIMCSGAPLYRVVWDTPGAWWGDTHWERYCHGCVTRGVREGWVRRVAPVSLAKATDPVSPLCPNVLRGCSHTMVQNGEGVGVACAEWADAHGIEWWVSSASVEVGAF